MGNLRRGRGRAPASDGVGGRAVPDVDAPGDATPHDRSRGPGGRSVAAASAGPLSGRKARSCGLVLAAASLALCLNWKRERRRKQAKGLI